jgi:hypothetical protein
MFAERWGRKWAKAAAAARGGRAAHRGRVQWRVRMEVARRAMAA